MLDQAKQFAAQIANYAKEGLAKVEGMLGDAEKVIQKFEEEIGKRMDEYVKLATEEVDKVVKEKGTVVQVAFRELRYG